MMDSDFEEIAVKKVYTIFKAMIRENLTVYPHHLDHLEANCVLTPFEVQQIRELVQTEQLNKILQILPTKGPKAFHCFLESIKDDHDKLVKYYQEQIRLMEKKALENRRIQPQPKDDKKTHDNSLQITPEIERRPGKPKPTLDPYDSYCDLKDWEESPTVSSQLNRMYRKLEAHLNHGHQREPSGMTHQTATLDGIERLTNDLLNNIESCYMILKEQQYAKPLKHHIFELKSDIESSNKSRQKLILINTELEKTVRDYDRRIKVLQIENETLSAFKKKVEECPRMATGAELNAIEEKYAELQKTSKSTIHKLQQEIEMHKAASEKWHRELDKTRTELDKTRTELDKTRTELDKTRTQLTKLSQETEKQPKRNISTNVIIGHSRVESLPVTHKQKEKKRGLNIDRTGHEKTRTHLRKLTQETKKQPKRNISTNAIIGHLRVESLPVTHKQKEKRKGLNIDKITEEHNADDAKSEEKTRFQENSIALVKTLQLLNRNIEEQDHKLLKEIVSRIANEIVGEMSYSIFKEYVRRFVNDLGFSGKFSFNETADIFNILKEIWQSPKFARYVMKEVYNEDVSAAVIPIRREISDQFPQDVQQLDSKAITLFYKALKDGKEKVNNIRLMVLGMYGVGKTSLVNNLIWELRNKTHTQQPLSTEGIDIHRCKLMTDGDWCLDEELKRVKYEGRIQKLVCNNQLSKDTHLATASNDETANSHITLYERITSTKDHETQIQTEPLQTFKDRIALQKDDEILQHGIKFAKKMLETNSDNSEKGKALLDESKSEISVSVWDFAGQTLYYSTHQFFLNKRSIYVVVMDMTKSLQDVVSKSDGIGIWCGLVDDCTYLDIFKFWLNAIHMNSDYQSGTIKPTVILVGTRKDEMKGSAEEIEKNMNLYFNDALCSFDDNSPIFEHIYRNRFLLNNLSPNDSAFGELQKEIISLAAKQDYWDEEYPVRWIHMEQTLNKMRAEKLQIVKMKDVEEEDLKNVHPLGKEELTLFLELQHKQGNIIYFNSGKLKDFVVLAPQWIIEAFKCFIPHNQKIEATVLKDWEEYKKHAILKPNVLREVMKNSPPYIHEYEDAVIRYMEYLNVIAQPLPNADAITGIPNQHERVQEETSGLYDNNPKMLNCHIVPCLLSRAPPPIDSFTSPHKPRTPVLAFVFCGKFMPPSFFHRLEAVCIRTWPISQERGQYCLFNGLAIFDLNSTYTLRIWYMDFIIYARIVCCSENAKLDNFVWRIQEVRHTLKNSLQDFVHQSSQVFDEYIQCPDMKVSLHNKGLFRVKQFDYETEIACPVCSIPHTVKRSDAMKHWFNEMLDQNETDVEMN